MPAKAPSLILLTLFGSAGYFLAGQLGLMLAAGPSNVSPIWPPAGIALALLLSYGLRAAPGIFVGAIAIHLTAFYTPDNAALSLLTGLATSLGSLLQALAAKVLADRWISRPFTLVSDKDILRFTALSPLACTVGASIGALTLYATGSTTLQALPLIWSTWWVGDTIGVLIVTPILLALLSKPTRLWRTRRLSLILPLCCTLLFIVAASLYAQQLNAQRILAKFNEQTQIATRQLENQVTSVLHFLHLNKHSIETAGQLDHKDFHLFATEQPDIPLTGLYWLSNSPEGWQVKDQAFVDQGHCLGQMLPPYLPPSVFKVSGNTLPLTRYQNGKCQGVFLYLPVAQAKTGFSVLVASISPQHLAEAAALQTLLPQDAQMGIRLLADEARAADWPQPPRMDKQHRLGVQTMFQIGDHYWLLTYLAPARYHDEQLDWGSWYVLFGGLLFSALLCIGLLLLTGRNSQISRTVEQRTAELAQEVSERKRGEKLLELQKTALEAIARDQPLANSLHLICEQFESVSPDGAMATVMTVHHEKQVLELRAGPSLTQPVAEALVVFPIGENEGSCGTAVHRGEVVVCPDIACNIEWQKYRDFAAAHQLGACWSMPIKSRSGEVLGSFALTHPQPRKPTEQDLTHLSSAATLCALAIEQDAGNAALKRLSLVVEQAPSGVLMADKQGQVIYSNARSAEIFGQPLSHIQNNTLSQLFDASFRKTAFATIWQQLLTGQECRESLQLRADNGQEIWTQCYFAPVTPSSGQVDHVVAIIDDVSELQKSSQKLAYQAKHDALTGLINRAEFDRRLAQMVSNARTHVEVHSLCFLDLDRFKSVNDTEGHTAGDELLRQLSLLMREQVRRGDVLARFGGDEFAILFEHCDLQQATSNTQSLRQKVTEYPFVWNGRSYHIGLSAGLVEINGDSPEPQELLRQADAACYRAKEQGRNRIHCYQRDTPEPSNNGSDIYWASQLREALTADRLVLFQQKIQPLEPSALASLEILVRMTDATVDPVPPGLFMPAAEKYGLMPQLDAWVLEHALQHFAAHPEQLSALNYCAVNLSGQSLTAEFATQIEHWLQQYGVLAEKLCLEITETAAIANLSQAQAFIHTLGERGIRFALDDFGSGLSSFAYLKNLPVDILKIDGQFVRDLNEDPIDYAMVEAINAIGKVMGKYTVAEFVENQAITNDLVQIGVDAVQGYGIHRPEPLDKR